MREGQLGRLDPRHASADAGSSSAATPGAADHDRADRPVHRRAHARAEEAGAGGRVRPRLLAAEERQPPARARRRGDAAGGQRGAPAAWQAALAYLEDEACVTRRGKNGVQREHAGGFVAAAYQHRTSRAQDPHLHTHVIVANMAQSPSDGKWRALDGEPILKSYRLAAGYLYQAQLRAELPARWGWSGSSRARAWPSSGRSARG